MRWFSNPQRDSHEDIRAAHEALMHAGHSRPEALAGFGKHLQRVRATLAEPRDVLLAGFLVGAVFAAGLTLTMAVAWFVMGVAAGPGVPAKSLGAGYYVAGGSSNPGNQDGSTGAPADTIGPSLLEIFPPAAAAVAILGLAGTGMALVTRRRWRSAGVLETLMDLAPRRGYLVETLAVWLGVGVLIVLIVRSQAGPQMAEGATIMLVSFGIPVLAAAFIAAFPALYCWALLRVSRLDAAAYARPIIEREAALRIESERATDGPSVYQHGAFERNRWADEVLARQDTPRNARRRR